MAPLLSATLIVRDEEANLGACLDSLAGFADEIVVIDTGSSDATVEIAEGRGARVSNRVWEDDFAAARNAALEEAAGAWVLYIDADERLQPIDFEAARARLREAPEAAFRIGLRPFAHATPFLEYRLWRASPEIRFRGVIHEQVVDAIHRTAKRDSRPISDWPELMIDHRGYEDDQARKNRRNLPLLRRRLEVDPESIFSLRHLARILLASDTPSEVEEGAGALETAVRLARDGVGPEADGCLAWSELVLYRQEQQLPVKELLVEGRHRWPENWQLVWLEGNAYLDAGEPEQAVASFRQLLAADRKGLATGGMAYDERIFGVFAQSSLGLAMFRMQRYGEAAAAYGAAAQLEPGNPEHEVKRSLAAARERAQETR